MARIAGAICLTTFLTLRVAALAAEEEDAAPGANWARYEIVLKRNIFDPDRSPENKASSKSQQVAPETLELTGVLERRDGQVAFFEGSALKTGSEVVKDGGSVAGLKVGQIRTGGVLVTDDKTTSTLRVGGRISRPAGGQWDWQGSASAPAESAVRETADGAGAKSSGGGDAAAKALEKLKERRRKELGS